MAEAVETAGPCADSDIQRLKGQKRAARCSETRAVRCSELALAADVAATHGQRRPGRTRAARCSGVADAVATAGPRADSDGQRNQGKKRGARFSERVETVTAAVTCADGNGLKNQETKLAAASSISFTFTNPKVPGSAAHARYDQYRVACTLAEAAALGAQSRDLQHDRAKGYLRELDPPKPTRRVTSKRRG